MEKVVFIINSKHYSLELLNNYVERNTECRAFNFFSVEEVSLYLNLKPSVIIYGMDEGTFNNGLLEKLRDSNSENTLFMGINKGYVRIDRLSNEGEMVLVDTLPYRDIYRDLHAMCYAEQL